MAAPKDDVETDAMPIKGKPEGAASYVHANILSILSSPETIKAYTRFVHKHFQYLPPELKVDHYDGMILYHESDYKGAELFQQTFSEIELSKSEKPKVVLYNGPELMSLAGGEFDNLEMAFERCTFAFLYLSKQFVKDCLCKVMSHSCMMEALDNEEKKWCVLPIITAPRKELKFKIPMGLNTLKEIKFYPPYHMFTSCMKSLLNGRHYVRKEKELKLLNTRFNYLKEKMQLTTANSNDWVDDSFKQANDNRQNEVMKSAQINGHSSSNSSFLSKNKQYSELFNGHTDCQTSDLETDGTLDTSSINKITERTDQIKLVVKPTVALTPKSCTNDDTDRTSRIVHKAACSVGRICGPNYSGIGFRVGTKYLATARHVILINTDTGGQIDQTKLRSLVNVEFTCKNQYRNSNKTIFNFLEVIYENEELDTIILELKKRDGEHFPQPISMISKLAQNSTVYIVKYSNRSHKIDYVKIEFYKLDKDFVEESKTWAMSKGIKAQHDYADIDKNNTVLFHCEAQHGAHGALGIMVDKHHDEPQSVLMLIRGYPKFLSDANSFSDEDKTHFLTVEQGVLLSSIYADMRKNPKYNEIVENITSTIKTVDREENSTNDNC